MMIRYNWGPTEASI